MTILAALDETWYLFFLTVAIAMTAWMVFIWAVRSGQFKNTEETAERMIELDARTEALPDPNAGDGALADPETGAAEAGTLGDRKPAESAARDER